MDAGDHGRGLPCCNLLQRSDTGQRRWVGITTGPARGDEGGNSGNHVTVPIVFFQSDFLPAVADWGPFRSGAVRVGGLERVSAAGRIKLCKDDLPVAKDSGGEGRGEAFGHYQGGWRSYWHLLGEAGVVQ
jgi:hypothetical protein